MIASLELPPARPEWALFLDLDGSIIELTATPDAVRVKPELRRLLDSLRDAFDGALAVVSGRPLKQIDRILALPLLPAAGLHGLERRRADGTVVRPPQALDDAELAPIKRALRDFARAHPGLMVEDKGVAVALHFRQAPERREACRQAVAAAVDDMSPRLEVLEGKMLFEIRPSGVDKGDAIEVFLGESPFAGRIPVYCGDDATDEHGFAVVNRFGGVSIHVGDGTETLARWRVGSVDELVAWLTTLPQALTGRRAARRA
ncbi:MAG: trehalose-phosphatase [Kiloniellales bacterium]